ncbi:hypothetical protein [Trichlorobacter thiogenes]|uniref:hypothetical protein n=1 Tax=Trichlorobacter thiogenes TaxID=115783 RepID=UPI00111660A0|nr:hypothetical protein [Trichlorobacter thiogenes]
MPGQVAADRRQLRRGLDDDVVLAIDGEEAGAGAVGEIQPPGEAPAAGAVVPRIENEIYRAAGGERQAGTAGGGHDGIDVDVVGGGQSQFVGRPADVGCHGYAAARSDDHPAVCQTVCDVTYCHAGNTAGARCPDIR